MPHSRFNDAIEFLRQEADARNQEGNLTAWAALSTSADVLQFSQNNGDWKGSGLITESECARRIKEAVAQTVRELVELATDDQNPEWINLVMDVQEGKYSPSYGEKKKTR